MAKVPVRWIVIGWEVEEVVVEEEGLGWSVLCRSAARELRGEQGSVEFVREVGITAAGTGAAGAVGASGESGAVGGTEVASMAPADFESAEADRRGALC
jgi:hypothetical protein